ncbi:hypothetical protein [Campylobacter coli]|uniref:hypothetical protein n=1 Tax=Campylobacter coli TaxID=195 RepID=UPI0011A2A442|nr:hypothetical protein [Campylobacter coli]
MKLLNKKFILIYAIYIIILACIYFFGKDLLNLIFLVFKNLWNFFSAIEGIYYALFLLLSLNIFICLIAMDILTFLIFLLIATPLLFVYFYYTDASFSLNYFGLPIVITAIQIIIVASWIAALNVIQRSDSR